MNRSLRKTQESSLDRQRIEFNDLEFCLCFCFVFRIFDPVVADGTIVLVSDGTHSSDDLSIQSLEKSL